MPAPIQLEDEFQTRLDTGLWWKIFRRALGHKRQLVPLFFASVGIAACDASFAQITRWVIDGVVRDGANASFTRYIIVYLIVTLLLCTGVFGFIELAGRLAHLLAYEIRRDCFDKLQTLEFAFFDARPVGWLITRLTSDCDRLARIIAWGFLDIVWGLSFVTMIAISLLVMNWRLGVIVLAIVPPLAVVSKFFQRKMLLSAREIRKYNSQITAGYNESIQGVRTTKTLVREAENLGEFQQLSTKMFDASVLNARQNALYFPIVTTLGTLAAGLALWRGGYLAINEALSLGTLVAFINFAGQFFNPVNQLAQRLTEMQGAQAAGERVMGLLATEPTIKDSAAVAARIAAAAQLPIADCGNRIPESQTDSGPPPPASELSGIRNPQSKAPRQTACRHASTPSNSKTLFSNTTRAPSCSTTSASPFAPGKPSHSSVLLAAAKAPSSRSSADSTNRPAAKS